MRASLSRYLSVGTWLSWPLRSSLLIPHGPAPARSDGRCRVIQLGLGQSLPCHMAPTAETVKCDLSGPGCQNQAQVSPDVASGLWNLQGSFTPPPPSSPKKANRRQPGLQCACKVGIKRMHGLQQWYLHGRYHPPQGVTCFFLLHGAGQPAVCPLGALLLQEVGGRGKQWSRGGLVRIAPKDTSVIGYNMANKQDMTQNMDMI